ncbi:DUF4430 domain-containing protein [Isoptericola variabilis]|uniref:Transcobalamin-like C-terminal domain-containing protein n=1 Tax=Isoptericola variabilis (strain 225) TaxID=743718 RepID=F6FWH4_ISOV2|nr:DUF4430 domain-containing protein [Isoptericola variabilis]AEG44548.1 hypothetical protein Isova_1802 [Isoptericola variabilis 225]TWH26535.1 uncharacterized protein DUF4430 [Isoptericola variabilis J7]
MTIALRLPRRLPAVSATVSAGLLAAALLAGCSTDAEPAAETAAEPTVSASVEADVSEGADTESAAPELTYAGQEGRTALELLLEADPSATVEGEGEMAFVTGIGGVEAGENEFWALYVDGEPAQVGAGSLVTEDGQEITWKLEAFE